MSRDTWVRRIIKFVTGYVPFILILVIALQVWMLIFGIAVEDYLETELWRARGVWLGNDSINLFGATVTFQFEGYTDYSFYYVHWGTNMLRGVLPYDPDFGYLVLNGYTNENGAYMFPPFYAYLYAAGIALPVDHWGIGLLIAIFGYLTVFPVYGIAKDLSNNPRVGEAAAVTYLFNPLTLYYTLFAWMNPAPFVFFFFLGFYMLLKNRKYTGTILIVCAALFKQTAWFLGLPLIAYLLVRPQPSQEPMDKSADENDSTSDKKGATEFLLGYFDLKGFLKSTIFVVSFVIAVFLPYIIATPWFTNNLLLAAGGFALESYTDLPSYGSPMRFQILAVAAGMPELAQFLDTIIYYGFMLTFGVMLLFGIMLLERRPKEHPKSYLRRILFLAMLLMLWVHLMGPRGVYKYYFVLFAPFFSIFSSAKMVQSKDDNVQFSFTMLIIPFLLSFAIILPSRTVYLFSVLLIFLSYLLVEQIGICWRVITTPYRWCLKRVRQRFEPVTNKLRPMKDSLYERLSLSNGS